MPHDWTAAKDTVKIVTVRGSITSRKNGAMKIKPWGITQTNKSSHVGPKDGSSRGRVITLTRSCYVNLYLEVQNSCYLHCKTQGFLSQWGKGKKLWELMFLVWRQRWQLYSVKKKATIDFLFQRRHWKFCWSGEKTVRLYFSNTVSLRVEHQR